MEEVIVEFIFAIEDLKVNKIRRIFLVNQLSQEKFAEYTFVIRFYKFNFLFGVGMNFNVSLKKVISNLREKLRKYLQFFFESCEKKFFLAA